VEKSNETEDPESKARPALPRGGFTKGALLALLIVLPAESTLLHLIATDPLAVELSAKEMFVTVAIFAGLPALIAFGSIGTRLARRAVDGQRANAGRGALLGAAAGLGVGILAAIPTAAFPQSTQEAILAVIGTLVIGALAGGFLGGWLARHCVIS
jgi:hypothetical protein